MALRTISGVALTLLLVGCAGGAGGGTNAPESVPNTGPEPRRRTAEMVVMRDGAGLERGDTVRVDLGRVSEAKRVSRIDGVGGAASLPLGILGPIGVDTMVVSADRVNVHRCRSRGCTVLGYVASGQLVQVHDFIGGWFRFTGPDGTRGYIHSDHLELLLLHRLERLDELRDRTATYYRQRLEGLESEAGRSLFSGYRVGLKDGLLRFDFFAADGVSGSMDEICNAMRGIARYVEARMRGVPPGVFQAYSAGIYAGQPGERGEMIAGLSGGGGVYCDSPG